MVKNLMLLFEMHPFHFVINVVMNVNVFLQATTGNVSLQSQLPLT